MVYMVYMIFDKIDKFSKRSSAAIDGILCWPTLRKSVPIANIISTIKLAARRSQDAILKLLERLSKCLNQIGAGHASEPPTGPRTASESPAAHLLAPPPLISSFSQPSLSRECIAPPAPYFHRLGGALLMCTCS